MSNSPEPVKQDRVEARMHSGCMFEMMDRERWMEMLRGCPAKTEQPSA